MVARSEGLDADGGHAGEVVVAVAWLAYAVCAADDDVGCEGLAGTIVAVWDGAGDGAIFVSGDLALDEGDGGGEHSSEY